MCHGVGDPEELKLYADDNRFWTNHTSIASIVQQKFKTMGQHLKAERKKAKAVAKGKAPTHQQQQPGKKLILTEEAAVSAARAEALKQWASKFPSLFDAASHPALPALQRERFDVARGVLDLEGFDDEEERMHVFHMRAARSPYVYSRELEACEKRAAQVPPIVIDEDLWGYLAEMDGHDHLYDEGDDYFYDPLLEDELAAIAALEDRYGYGFDPMDHDVLELMEALNIGVFNRFIHGHPY